MAPPSLSSFIVPRGAGRERAIGGVAEARCDLCAAPVGEPHRHLWDRRAGRPACACQACALLFPSSGGGALRYAPIPEQVSSAAAPALDEEGWRALGLPVQLACVRRDAAGRWGAIYPSAGGAVEAPLVDAAWASLAERSAIVGTLAPEVEALLVDRRRRRSAALEAVGDRWLRVPIDRAYQLVGVVRATWQGFHGGDAVQPAVDAWFARLHAEATPLDGRGARLEATEATP